MLVAPLALGLVGLFACEDEPSNGQTFDFPEAGLSDTTQPPIDSSTPPPDAPFDALPKPTTVSVIVTGRDGPRADVTIVFHDATGGVVETKTTGANGTAVSTVATAPAMVTALVGTNNDKHLVTWTGVEGGDALQLRDIDRTTGLVGNINVSFPYVMTDAGAIRATIEASGCDYFAENGTGPFQVPLYGDCYRASTSVLATAFDEGDTLVGYSFSKTVAPPADGGEASVTTGDWNPPTTTTVMLANTSANDRYEVDLYEISQGFGYRKRGVRDVDVASVPFATAGGFADAIQGNMMIRTSSGSRAVVKRQPVSTSITLDWGQALPTINDVTRDATDARRPTFTWTAAASLANTDGGILRTRFYGTQDANYFWTFVVPPNATSVKAPALPAQAEDWLPIADAGAEAYGELPDVLFVESDLLPGYAQFRAQQGVLLGIDTRSTRLGGNISVPTLPQNGSLRATLYHQIEL